MCYKTFIYNLNLISNKVLPSPLSILDCDTRNTEKKEKNYLPSIVWSTFAASLHRKIHWFSFNPAFFVKYYQTMMVWVCFLFSLGPIGPKNMLKPFFIAYICISD